MKVLTLSRLAMVLPKPLMAAKAAIHALPPARDSIKIFDPQITQISADDARHFICVNLRNLRIKFFLSEAKESGRFFVKKALARAALRKKLLSRRLGTMGRLKGGLVAAVPHAPTVKNFLRSFFIKKRPLCLSEI